MSAPLRRLALALALSAAVGACKGQTPLVSLQPSPDLSVEDYEDVLGRWTRKDKVYDKLESKLFVHATFHSPEFRRAFLLRHPEVYGRGSEVARMLALTAPEADEALEFFVSAFTTDMRWNDFDEEDSIWRVTLIGESGEPVDGEVRRLKTTANLRVIYPFITDFARTYSVRFPRTDPSGRPVLSSRSEGMKLRFVSAVGQATLTWRLRPIETSTVTDE